jgi:ABC-2 type transport system ATP-binding protein
MKRDGRTVLLTTHYLDEAEQLCDRIAVIHGGRIIAAGAPRELIASSSATPSVDFVASRTIDPDLLGGVPDLQDLECNGTNVRFRTPEVTHTLAAVMRVLENAGIEVAELHVRKSTLEDIFLELTGADLPETDLPPGSDLPPEGGSHAART